MEADNLRKRNVDLENEMSTLKRRTQDLQIQVGLTIDYLSIRVMRAELLFAKSWLLLIKVDQLSYERDSLNKSYEEEMKKRVSLENAASSRTQQASVCTDIYAPTPLSNSINFTFL